MTRANGARTRWIRVDDGRFRLEIATLLPGCQVWVIRDGARWHAELRSWEGTAWYGARSGAGPLRWRSLETAKKYGKRLADSTPALARTGVDVDALNAYVQARLPAGGADLVTSAWLTLRAEWAAVQIKGAQDAEQ